MLPRMPSILTKNTRPPGGGSGGGSSYHPGSGQGATDDPYVTADEKEYMRNQRRDYFYRNGKKLGADGKPYVKKEDPNIGKYPLGTGDDDEDPDANTMEMDDEGRFPDEPGYGKGPDWRPPFQTGGVDDPSDAEIAFMMDDANYGIGGDLLETNTETGANISTFELGKGYGNVGGWEPTKREKTGSKGSSITSSMSPASKPGNTRRDIRARKTLISGAR